jgi:4-amino-4-deoxy-L-arabinose transferase-like glycosyltransferase
LNKVTSTSLETERIATGKESAIDRMSVKAEVALVAALCLLGLFLRAWRLDVIPPGLWLDEASNGLHALELLEGGAWRIFFQYEEYPREPLFVYLVLPLVKLLGAQPYAIRLAGTISGALTLPIAYLFFREFFGRRTALAALACLVFLRWHVHFSRTGFRTIMAPPFMLAAFYFLHRGWRTERLPNWALAGAAFAGGFYTYLSFRLVPLVLLLWLVFRFKIERQPFRPKARGLVLMFGVWLLILAPLIVHYIKVPYHFHGRTGQISLFKDGAREGVRQVAANARDVALMFSVRGDHEGRHNPPERRWIDERGQLKSKPPMPVFDPVSSLFFYLGLAVAFFRARRSAAWLLALVWLFVMSLNSVLSFGAPNLLRALSMAPIVALLMGEGLLLAGDYLGRRTAWRQAAWGLVAVCFCWFAGWQTWSYFYVFPQIPAVWGKFNGSFCDLARYAIDTAPDFDVFLPGDRWSHPTVKYLTHGVPGIYELTLPDALARPTEQKPQIGEDNPPRGRMIVFTQFTGINSDLAQLFPTGRFVKTFRESGGPLWAGAFYLPPAALKTREEIERHFAGRIGVSVFPER